MCEASSNYNFRNAKVGDIAQVGTVPNHPMKGLFEDGKRIYGSGNSRGAALLICATNGAQLFIEKMNLVARLGNSEFANAEHIEATFYTAQQEFAVGDGFVMKNGLLIPLTDIVDGTRVRFARAFA